MTIKLVTYKIGYCDKWFTYMVHVDGARLNSPKGIYRMYTKEQTAINNGIRLLQKHLAKKK